MSKLIVIAFILVAAGVVWIRMQWARSKNKNASKQIVADLKSGKYVIESYADSLNIMISSKPISHGVDTSYIKQYLNSLNGKKLLNKFNIDFADMNENSKGIIIGEAFVKDFIHDKEMDVFYPCWVYLDINNDKKEISFKSTFPENKDHHYLLEDLSNEIYKQCNKAVA